MAHGPWPFKHLKQTSSWPMQSLVLQLAASVLQAPAPKRKQAAEKVIERAVRMGARLACEFGMPPALFVEIAKSMIIKEGGSKAQTALAQATTAVKYESAEHKAEVDKLFEMAGLPGENDDDPPEA
jgi:hypothetical protein